MEQFEKDLNELFEWIEDEHHRMFRADLTNFLSSTVERLMSEVDTETRTEESGKYKTIEKLQKIEKEIRNG